MALLGTGASLAWDRREDSRVGLAVLAAVLAGAAYAVWLLPGRGVGTVAGFPEAVIVLAIAAGAALVVVVRGRPLLALGLAAAAIVVVPAVASASVVTNSLGPFDPPFESTGAFAFARALGRVGARTEALLPPLETARGLQPDLMATQTSAVAAPFILDSGQEVVPIGGFSGTAPQPSLAGLREMIARGDFHLVIQAPTDTDPRLVWVANHCVALPTPAGAAQGSPGLRFAIYYCGRPPV